MARSPRLRAGTVLGLLLAGSLIQLPANFDRATKIFPSGTVHAASVVAESFDSAVGDLDAQNGGSGWSGAWTATTASESVADPGTPLSFTTVEGSTVNGGNSALRIAGNDDNLAHRALAPRSDDHIYISYLFRFAAGAVDNNDFVGIWLDTVSTGTHNTNRPNTGFNGNSTTPNDANPDLFARFVNGQDAYAPSPTYNVVVGSTYLVVAHFQKQTPGAAEQYTRAELWVNPAFGDASSPDAVVTGTSIANFDRVGIRTVNLDANDIVLVDEFKMGTTWADVVPGAGGQTLPSVAGGWRIRSLAQGGQFAGQHMCGMTANPTTGDLYVATNTNGARFGTSESFTLWRVTQAGGVSPVGVYPVPHREVVILAWGSDGHIYTAATGGDVIRINPGTGAHATFASTGLELYRYGLQSAPNGDLILYRNPDGFYKITASGAQFLGGIDGNRNEHGDSFGIQPDGDYVIYPDGKGNSNGPNVVTEVKTANHAVGSPFTIRHLTSTPIDVSQTPNLGVAYGYSIGAIDPATGDVYCTTAGFGLGSRRIVRTPGDVGPSATSSVFVDNIGLGIEDECGNARGVTAMAFTLRHVGATAPSLYFVDDTTKTVYEAYSPCATLTCGSCENFSSSAGSWAPVLGTWVVSGGAYQDPTGPGQRFNSVKNSQTLSGSEEISATFTRGGTCTSCANSVILRGDSSQLYGAQQWWKAGYYFQITRNGSYSVYKILNGQSSPLKNWTTSAAIVTSDAGNAAEATNTVRVVANGNTFHMFINDTHVLSITDTVSPLTSGNAGVAWLRSLAEPADYFRIDSARVLCEAGQGKWSTLPAEKATPEERNAPVRRGANLLHDGSE